MQATTQNTTDAKPDSWDRLEIVPQENRTVDRDNAAREMLRWQSQGLDLSAVEMEDRGEYSAQHYRNVSDRYGVLFEEHPDTESPTSKNISEVLARSMTDIDVPTGVDKESYVRGYIDKAVYVYHND